MKIGTADIREYILARKREAFERGDTHIVMTANDIHKALKLENRMPMVCNAMRQSMTERDTIVHQTASGYSSTVKIDYFLK